MISSALKCLLLRRISILGGAFAQERMGKEIEIQKREVRGGRRISKRFSPHDILKYTPGVRSNISSCALYIGLKHLQKTWTTTKPTTTTTTKTTTTTTTTTTTAPLEARSLKPAYQVYIVDEHYRILKCCIFDCSRTRHVVKKILITTML